MIAELSVLPLGEGAHIATPVNRVIDLVRKSGVTYQVNAMGTIVEGEPDLVWALLRQCHELALSQCARVITEVRIDQGRELAPA